MEVLVSITVVIAHRFKDVVILLDLIMILIWI